MTQSWPRGSQIAKKITKFPRVGEYQISFNDVTSDINITENKRKALDDGNIGCGVFVDL